MQPRQQRCPRVALAAERVVVAPARQQEAEAEAPAGPHRQSRSSVHSPQPYGFADFTTADVFISNHIFFIVDDFFAHCSRCLGKTTVGIRRCSLVLDRPRAAPKTHFVRHFCEISNGDCLKHTAEAVRTGSQIVTPSWNELFAQEADKHLRGRKKPFWKCS